MPVDLPIDGDHLQKLTFTKVSGDPKLALALQPRETLEVGFGMVWTVIWLTLGIGLTVVLRGPQAGAGIRRHSPHAMIAVGLIVFFLLPAPISWLGFVLFLIGTLWFSFRYRRAAA